MSLEQIFQNQICLCSHSIPEEHELGKCYALDQFGNVWKACDCKSIQLMPFQIKVEKANVSSSPIPKVATAKPTTPARQTIQWGKSAVG